MAAIFECSECGFQAVFEQEDNLNQCPVCSDIHVNVTYGVSLYVSFRDRSISKVRSNEQ